MTPRAPLLLTGLAFLASTGCPKRVDTRGAPEPSRSGVGLVSLKTQPSGPSQTAPDGRPLGEKERRQAVLDAATPLVLPCYQAAVARDPLAYGELLIRYSLDEDGGVRDLFTSLDTVGDPEMVTCVEGAVRALRFPVPSRPGALESYPFLFTTDRTPAEVVRAMKARHGLLPKEERGEWEPGDPARQPPPGTVETW
jgi:hypothetical protein